MQAVEAAAEPVGAVLERDHDAHERLWLPASHPVGPWVRTAERLRILAAAVQRFLKRPPAGLRVDLRPRGGAAVVEDLRHVPDPLGAFGRAQRQVVVAAPVDLGAQRFEELAPDDEEATDVVEGK